MHVFLIKAANSLMSSHPCPPTNIWWLDSNSSSRRCVQQIKNGTLMHTVHSFVTIDYTLFDFVGHPIFQLGSILVTRILNQITRHQRLWISGNLGTDITTCSHIAEIDAQAFCFNDSCKSCPFFCITSEKCAVTCC